MNRAIIIIASIVLVLALNEALRPEPVEVSIWSVTCEPGLGCATAVTQDFKRWAVWPGDYRGTGPVMAIVTRDGLQPVHRMRP